MKTDERKSGIANRALCYDDTPSVQERAPLASLFLLYCKTLFLLNSDFFFGKLEYSWNGGGEILLVGYQFAPSLLGHALGDQLDEEYNTHLNAGDKDNEVEGGAQYGRISLKRRITTTDEANGDNCSLDSERSLGTAWERLGKHTYTHPHIHHNDDDDDIDVHDNSDGDDWDEQNRCTTSLNNIRV